MTDLVERYAGDSFLPPDQGALVMRPILREVPVHWHDFYELCLVLDGTADHVLNGVRRRVGPGSAFLLSPADLHALEIAPDEELACLNTVVAPDLMERVLGRLGGVSLEGFPWQSDDLLAVAPDLERLSLEQRDRLPGSRGMSEALLTCVVVELARRADVDRDGGGLSADADDLRRAVLYVDRNFREPLTLAAVAAQAHLSPNYFSEQFRARTGSSFQHYLQARRLGFARALLRSTTMSVTEVCHAAGFRDLSHFGRAYRRRFGASPSAR
jgi:AraC-like DNA-binding protein